MFLHNSCNAGVQTHVLTKRWVLDEITSSDVAACLQGQQEAPWVPQQGVFGTYKSIQ